MFDFGVFVAVGVIATIAVVITFPRQIRVWLALRARQDLPAPPQRTLTIGSLVQNLVLVWAMSALGAAAVFLVLYYGFFRARSCALDGWPSVWWPCFSDCVICPTRTSTHAGRAPETGGRHGERRWETVCPRALFSERCTPPRGTTSSRASYCIP